MDLGPIHICFEVARFVAWLAAVLAAVAAV
jgi:hypothetical protein